MPNKVVSREEWLTARKELLAKEKAFMKEKDKLSAEIRELPWVKVEKEYTFDTPQGKKSLSDLFDGKSQLALKHFMMAPGQSEGCVGCSFETDHMEPAYMHLRNHDVAMVCVARCPLSDFLAFQTRMGWTIPFVSSYGSDFNYDFGVSFKPEEMAAGKAYYNYEHIAAPIEDLSGHSIFYKDDKGDIYHTYSSFGRGMEGVLASYAFLDVVPNGRMENGPHHSLVDWVRHHDRYEAQGHVSNVGRWVAAEISKSPLELEKDADKQSKSGGSCCSNK